MVFFVFAFACFVCYVRTVRGKVKIMLDLEIIDALEILTDEQVKMLQDLIQYAAQELDVKEGECSISILSNDEIQIYNAQYRGKDMPTDVLSFAMQEQGDPTFDFELEDELPALGDIFISYERIQEQAKTYGHSFERELGFLAVHGFLHLMGYDHMTEKDEEEMFELQKNILDHYGLKRVE